MTNAEIIKALETESPYTNLVALVAEWRKRYVASEVTDFLAAFRKANPNLEEGLDDVVMDVMDRLVGYCRKGREL